MASGISKLQLLIDLKNKLGAGLNEAKNQVKKATGDMQGKLDAFKTKNIEAFNSIKDEVPGAARAMQLLSNPIVAATATVAALGYGIIKCTQEAEKFSGGFRQLQMLNLDKSTKDMGRLKSMIRSTAYEKGFDPTDTIKAFFDVQSTTGKFGTEVDSIIAKQGEFARLMQADFKQWISGTAKAMANYGFGAEKLDEFNKAAFATVQTGVTTFDELAQVQSMFAGAAAASKQSFASADKIFSIFTVKVKDVNEAATLTKSLFNDLSKATTIESFKKLGINVFDANKQFKQADVLLLELQQKFRQLGTSDSKLIELKNQFAGSEGLIAYVQAATDKTNQLQNTINTFDATQFALPKALEIAKNDINYINEQLENRTKVLMGEIGDKFIPIKKFFLEVTNGAMEGTKRLFTGINKSTEEIQNKSAITVLKDIPGLSNPTKLSNPEFDQMMAKVNKDIQFYQNITNENLKFRKSGGFLDKFDAVKSQGFFNYQFASGAITNLMELQKQAQLARSKMPEGDFVGVTGTDPNKPDTPTTPIAANAQSIASSSQTKSVVINIDSFIKGFNSTNQSVNGMGKDELERWLTEMFLRVVRSAETTM
jgi:TP901 family phage tail tape measure protein